MAPSPPASGAQPRRRRLRAAAVCAISAAAIAFAALVTAPALGGLNNDIQHFLRAVTHDQDAPLEEAAVVIAAIDEATYLDPHFANRPRAVWTPELAQVQDALLNAGVRAVAWDLILPTSAAAWTTDIALDRPLLFSLRKGASKGQVVLGEAAFRGRRVSPFAGYAFAVGGAANIRLVNTLVDGDGVVRSVPLMTFEDGETGQATVPSLVMEAAMRGGATEIDWRARDNKAIVSFDPARPIPVHSVGDLRACAERGEDGFFQDAFRDKVVVLGLILNLEDRKTSSARWMTGDNAIAAAPCETGRTPLDYATRSSFGTPGPLILATAIDNLISGRSLSAPPTWVSALLLAVASMIAASLSVYARPAFAAAGAGALILMAPVTGVILLQWLWIAPMVEGASAAISSLAAGMMVRVLFSAKREAVLRRAFSAYLDDRMMKQLLEDETPPKLGGETREMTSLFVDIAGFSGLSERLSSADLVAFLNRFFEAIQREVRARGGMIERFAGDAVIAIYGAPIRDPDHAEQAVRTAIAARAALAGLRDPEGDPVKARFGVNTGPATVGNIGAVGRLSYTAIGDAVNLASRLEGANKAFGTWVLCGAATQRATTGVKWRRIGPVQVVGREDAEPVFQPISLAEDTNVELEAAVEAYHAALALAEAGDLTSAYRAAEAPELKDDAPAKALRAELKRRIAEGDDSPFSFRLAVK